MKKKHRFQRFILSLLVGALIPAAGLFSPAAGSGDRLIAAESRRQVASISSVIRSLVQEDDALISLGQDDPVRHRRINRLLGMENRVTASFESTAVAAAMLDLLGLDASLRRSALYPDLLNATDNALRTLLPAIEPTRLPVAGEIGDLRDPEQGRVPAPRGRPRPMATPTLPNGAPPVTPIFLEGAPHQPLAIDAGNTRSMRWLPGSRFLLTVADDRLRLVDADGQAPTADLGPRRDEQFTASASGEYLAAVFSGRGGDALRLLRLGPGGDASAGWDPIDNDPVIVEARFSPRALQLAYLKGGDCRIHDVVQRRSRSLGSVAGLPEPRRLSWSPDGRYLLVAGFAATGGREGLVFDAAATLDPSPVHLSGSHTGWDLDSRSLVALLYSGISETQHTVFIQRTTPEGLGSETKPDEPSLLPVFLTSADESADGFSWSPDGQHIALRVHRPGRDAIDERLRPGGLDPDRAVPWRSVVKVFSFVRDPATPIDPPTTNLLADFAWHPSGYWYAARHAADSTFSGLWIHDLARGDAWPVGSPRAGSPAFSPDGGRLAFLDGPAGRRRIHVRPLQPVPAGLTRGREEASRGGGALRAGDVVGAVQAYRNAVRLAPGEARHFQGLGRAYLVAAITSASLREEVYYLDAATRALASAYELAGDVPDIRVDLMDTMARRAVRTGVLVSRSRSASMPDRIRAILSGSEFRRESRGRDIVAALVDAILWDPWDEYNRILLEGVLVHFPNGAP